MKTLPAWKVNLNCFESCPYGCNGLSIGQAHGSWRVSELNLKTLASVRWIYRAWYYFRLGYSTYLTFVLGYVSTLITVYYLAIKNMPDLLDLFPHFVPFAVLATVVGAPLAVAIGWIHMKRSLLYSSEQDISVEANPYNYKLIPGYFKEVVYPLYRELLVQQTKILESQKLLDDKERSRIEDLRRKLEILIQGGSVGSPRAKL